VASQHVETPNVNGSLPETQIYERRE